MKLSKFVAFCLLFLLLFSIYCANSVFTEYTMCFEKNEFYKTKYHSIPFTNICTKFLDRKIEMSKTIDLNRVNHDCYKKYFEKYQEKFLIFSKK